MCPIDLYMRHHTIMTQASPNPRLVYRRRSRPGDMQPRPLDDDLLSPGGSIGPDLCPSGDARYLLVDEADDDPRASRSGHGGDQEVPPCFAQALPQATDLRVE